MSNTTITYRIDSDGWIRVCELYHNNAAIIVRANKLYGERVVSDTHRDKSQEIRAKGFVRIRPSQEYDFKI